MRKRILVLAVLGLCLGGCLLAWRHTDNSPLPSLREKERTLLRIWVLNAPGGGQAWLKQQLRAFEKAYPGIATWLRNVTPEDLSDPQAVLPDVLLYMPGDLTAPEELFLPLSGEMLQAGLLREELLRCGRWQGQQYGLPLCWGSWVLAVSSSLEPGRTATPAPTTLLGRPAVSPAEATPEPGYPYAAACQTAYPVQAPGGCALFTLGMLATPLPPPPEDFGHLSSAAVYEAFRHGQCATAMLTTGQAVALANMGSSSVGHRIMTPEEVVTDQVWLASVTKDAPPQAGLLLAHLVSADAQKSLYGQGLHTVRRDVTLYTAGFSARVEQAARRTLCAVNAYLPIQQVHQAAWQYLQGILPLSDALSPLM